MDIKALTTVPLVFILFVVSIIGNTETGSTKNLDLLFLLRHRGRIELTNDFTLKLTRNTSYSKLSLSPKTMFPNNRLFEEFAVLVKLKLSKKFKFPATLLTIRDPDNADRFSISFYTKPGYVDNNYLVLVYNPIGASSSNSYNFTLPYVQDDIWTFMITIADQKITLYTSCDDTKRPFGFQFFNISYSREDQLFKNGAGLYLFHDGHTKGKLRAEIYELTFSNYKKKIEFLCSNIVLEGSADKKLMMGDEVMGNVLKITLEPTTEATESTPSTIPPKHSPPSLSSSTVLFQSSTESKQSTFHPLSSSTLVERIASKPSTSTEFTSTKKSTESTSTVTELADSTSTEPTSTSTESTSTLTESISTSPQPTSTSTESTSTSTESTSTLTESTSTSTESTSTSTESTSTLTESTSTSSQPTSTLTESTSTSPQPTSTSTDPTSTSTESTSTSTDPTSTSTESTSTSADPTSTSTESTSTSTDPTSTSTESKSTTKSTEFTQSSTIELTNSTTELFKSTAETIKSFSTVPTKSRESTSTTASSEISAKLSSSVIVSSILPNVSSKSYSAAVGISKTSLNPIGCKLTDSEMKSMKQSIISQYELETCKVLKNLRLAIPKRGEKGEKGDQGSVGINGTCSPSVCKQLEPKEGPKGSKGDPGFCIPSQCKSEKGDRGEAGYTGDAGPKGDKGDTGIPTLEQMNSLINSAVISEFKNENFLRNLKGSKGEPGKCNCNYQGVNKGFYAENGFEENINIGYGSLVFENQQVLEQVSYRLPLGSMVYILKSEIFLIKIDQVNNIWKSILITSDGRLREWILPVPMQTPKTEFTKPPYVNGRFQKLYLIALITPTLGDLKPMLRQPGGYSGAAFQCQQAGDIYGLGKSLHPLLNTDMFNMKYIINDANRLIPIFNMRDEIIAANFNSLLQNEIQNEILDFKRNSITDNPLAPCVWIGKEPSPYDTDYSRTAEHTCLNWMSRSPIHQALTLSLHLSKSLFSDENKRLKSCSTQCYLLCIQTEPGYL